MSTMKALKVNGKIFPPTLLAQNVAAVKKTIKNFNL
jgi:hypothetical protein